MRPRYGTTPKYTTSAGLEKFYPLLRTSTRVYILSIPGPVELTRTSLIQPFIHSDGPDDGVVPTWSASGGRHFHFLGILKGVDQCV